MRVYGVLLYPILDYGDGRVTRTNVKSALMSEVEAFLKKG